MRNKQYSKKYFEDRDQLNLILAESIRIFMTDNHLKKILDVGCGTGKLVKFLNNNGFNAFGCDNSTIAVNIAKKNNKKGRVYKATATNLPFKNNSFDFLACISTIEHLTINEMHKFLDESYRLIKTNGFIFIVTPNFASPFRYLFQKKWFGYSDPTHVTFFTPSLLGHNLKKHGFLNTHYWFKTKRNLVTYILYSTPLCFIRDSFWISAQKK